MEWPSWVSVDFNDKEDALDYLTKNVTLSGGADSGTLWELFAFFVMVADWPFLGSAPYMGFFEDGNDAYRWLRNYVLRGEL